MIIRSQKMVFTDRDGQKMQIFFDLDPKYPAHVPPFSADSLASWQEEQRESCRLTIQKRGGTFLEIEPKIYEREAR